MATRTPRGVRVSEPFTPKVGVRRSSRLFGPFPQAPNRTGKGQERSPPNATNETSEKTAAEEKKMSRMSASVLATPDDVNGGVCHAGQMSGEDETARPETLKGDGWETANTAKPDYASAQKLDDLVPKANWFWGPLQRWCVPGCCGIEAYDFSPEFVRWVAHLSTEAPERDNWRHEEAGDVPQLAADLRDAAVELRKKPTTMSYSRMLELYFMPQELADIFDDLASALAETSNSSA